MRASFALSTTFVAALSLAGTNAASPPVTVSLRSSWPSPPFLLEAIETIALEEPDAFFPLLDVLTDPETLPSREPLRPEALHQLALQAALSLNFLSKHGALTSVEMQFALHAATPKIEAFYQHYLDTAASFAESRNRDECESWVDWYGEVVCDMERLVHLAGPETIDSINATSQSSDSFVRPRTLPFDHIYPLPAEILDRPSRTAIFHASIDSPNFRELHSCLLRLSSGPAPRLEYVFRPIPPAAETKERTYISGYGVTLDLKKMDYLALDDRHSNSRDTHDDETIEKVESPAVNLDPIVSLLSHHPLNTTLDASEPLTEEELMEIGIQATQLIHESSTPFETLKQLAQDFPRYASSLARRVIVNSDVRDEVSRNSMKAQPGVSAVWFNGATVPETSMNPFGLLKLIRKERDIMSSLSSLGIEPSQALDLITHPAIQAAHGSSGSLLDGVFDASDRLEDGGLIVWWNDIEKDSRYARWPTGIHALMRPTYPGQIPVTRLNLFNVVLVMDLSQSSSLYYIAGTIANIINRSFPVRFGIVPSIESEGGARMAKIFNYLVDNYGRARTMVFIKKVLQLPAIPQMTSETVDWDRVRFELADLIKVEEPKEGGVALDFDTVVNDAPQGIQAKLDKARTYAKRLGATMASSAQGHAFFNGKHYDLDETFVQSLQMQFPKYLQYLQERLYEGALDQVVDVSTYFYDLSGSHKSRNGHIFPSSNADGLEIHNMVELTQSAVLNTQSTNFVYPPEVDLVPFTIYVVADLDTENGLSIVQEALSYVGTSRARLSFIHNPKSSEIGEGQRRVSALLSHLVSKEKLWTVQPALLLKALGLKDVITTNDHEQIVLSPDAVFQDLIGSIAPSDLDVSKYEDYVRSCHMMVRSLRLRRGETALVVNGRLVGPMGPGEFSAEDFKVLEDYEYVRRVEPVISALGDVLSAEIQYDRHTFAQRISMISSIISSIHIADPSEAGLLNQPVMTRNQNYKLMESQFSGCEFGNTSTALYQFAVVLDPLSEQAQRYTSLFEWLSSFSSVHVAFYINPAQYHELPLKRFYRYNLRQSLTFDESGQEIPSNVQFSGLPIDPIYTLGLDEPSSWLVRPREALYDLDNIQLGTLSGDERSRGVEVIYELDYLIVGGHARDTFTNAPPRGVQLQLSTTNVESIPIDDTLVVANLGYLQFKAKPGVYRLEIREGRGRDIFSIESVGNDGWDSPTVEEVGDEITLTSFEGLTLYPRLNRLPGMEQEEVLNVVEEEKEPTNIIDTVISHVHSFFHPKDLTDIKPASPHGDINIFTVASGLLYERFASIMILSVLRNTKHSVKFWFIENFLSPSFLEFIPHFAEEYGFKYELVTYKWPTWLRQQREKQRIIWAYKILFLDVLFPMDLDKVIFVDADQIVRTDLKELIDLDLHGAPYGYTPMGDDNHDMEGFRFWKTGYWENFLRGRPYHISALYVVDLVRFRQMAAGDILRSHYQQLSADPNSLANLDQDLPNNLQMQVPIYSLHEDWLWCETWCSKDRLHRAKTIDLCQNPLTKEPKLSRARQIPEWEEYDTEIAKFARLLAEDGRIHSSAATADVNALARAGTTPAAGDVDLEDETSRTPVRDEL